MEKTYLVVDVETSSGKNEDGHPFDSQNKLLFVGCFDGYNVNIFNIEYSSAPYGAKLQRIQEIIDAYDCLVFFNAKFDLHWLRRYGINFDTKEIYDCQYAEYCLSGQVLKLKDNSVDAACGRRGLEGKLPFDHTAPEHTLEEWTAYLHRDLYSEWGIFESQQRQIATQDQLAKLIYWGCQDLKNTELMEYNGLLYDSEKSIKIGDDLLEKVVLTDSSLFEIAPYPDFNWASPDNVSTILYGGTYRYTAKELVSFTYKTGQTIQKLKNVEKEIVLPRLVEPFKNSASKNINKETFSTEEGILRRLKASGPAKQIINLLLRRRELEKKVGTYYHGIPKLSEKMGWQDGLIHGQLNHCVAATGRLSSSKPNLQNLEKQMRQCVLSRFPI